MRATWLQKFGRLNDPAPHARVLSNGRLTTVLTSAGTGYTAWRDTQLTGWEGNRVEDGDGTFIYLRDLDSGSVWAAGHQPIPDARACDASYSPGCVTLRRRTNEIESCLAVCIAPDVDVEVRELTLTNRSDRPRRIEVSSYFEIVLNQRPAHYAHPAFSKLFVQTELAPGGESVVARRRPRSPNESPPWLACALRGDGALQYETDRARFLGRGRSLALPAALAGSDTLSGTVGGVLDPVMALRRISVLAPGESARLDLLLAAGPDRAAALGALEQCAAPASRATVFARAAEAEQSLAAALTIDARTAESYQELAGAILYGHPALRAESAVIERAAGALAQIWAYGLGGAPLAAVCIERGAEVARARELLTAQLYWARKAVRIDLLLLCGPAVSADATAALSAPAGSTLVVRRRQEIPSADVDVLLASAQLVVTNRIPSLAARGARAGGGRARRRRERRAPRRSGGEPLRFDNGVGGFSADGTEYVIRVSGDRRPPLAWTNVIARDGFGFLVSESGAACTWSQNSHEHRLTPWYNDPLRDPHGEALYLRDDASGAYWSPQPGPAAAAAPYEVRHGFGYSSWSHSSHGLQQEVVAFLPPDDALRIVRVRVANPGEQVRRVSLFAYQRLVLGVLAGESGRYVVTEHDAEAGMLVARNRVNAEFSGGEVFASAAIEDRAARIGWSTDRAAFIGRNGTPSAPQGVARGGMLEGAAGAALDPCFALQIACEIPAGGAVECAFLLGQAADRNSARAVVQRYRRMAAVDAALTAARAAWHASLTAVQVETPVPAIDLMVNGWLLYQSMSCRLWGRSALYQSGGAIGFRDQLQDSAALVYAHPELTRAQILLHAADQFVEGDVLHWWHPPTSRGTRTRFSDDLLWLPYIACFYAGVTGDWGVFDETVGFLTTRQLAAGEHEAYLQPDHAKETAALYEHCCRAIDRSLTRGAHGLPLMGTGDWNDGMNLVGAGGRGESVWLGFFLHRVLDDFIPLCRRRGDAARAQRYEEYRSALGAALNEHAWDGAWYRRAYFDDGSPLGSAQNSECRIDALAQAWSVISGVAPPERAAQAMEAVEAELVDRPARLIRLLTPPFDRDPHDPGYIKGYLPGIRENGGQYTHGATWVVRAAAELGRRDRAAAYLEMLSPVTHGGTAERLAIYQVEPYVVVADIYGVAPWRGRGGWTWYTGSAAWLYRVAIESVLGVRLEGGTTLVVDPRIPDDWQGFRVRIRLRDGRTHYQIAVENPQRNAQAVASASADGQSQPVVSGRARVALVTDGAVHEVRVILGPRS
jgi:cyclic beta-1,2-glucan synthetase